MPSFSKPTLFSRVAALTALLIVGFGKNLHLHQECGHCCHSSHAAHSAPLESDSQQKTCPFGCPHHSHTNDSEEKPSAPAHDEHNCAVCSLLAQAPSVPFIVTLPEIPALVSHQIELSSEHPSQADSIQLKSRGPPCGESQSAA